MSNRIASSANNTLVFGNNVSATAANNVILGDGSSENSTTTTNGAFNQVNTATVGLLTYSGFKGTATGIVSVGASGKERQIINVAPGNISATSTDAINGSQLYATNGVLSNVANSTVTALGGTTVLNPNGTFNVTYNLTTTNPNDNTTTNYTSIGDALKGLSDAVNQPLTFKADEGSSVQKLGSTISIVSGNATDTSTENLKTNVTKDGTIEISFSTKPTFTNVTVNETLKVGNVTINATTGIDAGNTVITNVANGTNATDAVNVSQLKEVTQNITNVTNEVAKGWNVTATASEGKVNGSSLEKVAMGDTFTVDAGKNIEITQSGKTISIATSATPTFTNITLSNGTNSAKIGSDDNGNVRVTGKDGYSTTKITNVAPGTNTTDAVNYGQLKSVERKVDKLDGRVRGIGASSAAAASLPQVYIPGKSMVAASAGGYSGASAIAVGYSRASDSGKVILKLTGTANSEGHYSGGVGVGYQW
ncbi:YadA family autotransporter adhesin [Caviibacterium pharyngocola]|uniref:YadA family autotransporter adhesin n=1 Tax=Caviibacterium pharyngocola TaxID=28159 RepID=UPI001FAE8B79|nr:YadA-like family protein [Caviibacterium pharyngocola]